MSATAPTFNDGIVRVAALTRFNWEQVLDLTPEPAQRVFMPDLLHSIAQSKFENCTPCGIWFQGTLCGFLLYCQFQQACWISRVLVDHRWQRQGIAQRAVNLVVKHLRSHPGCREVRTSVAAENFAALALFVNAGFEPMGDDEAEIVMRYRG